MNKFYFYTAMPIEEVMAEPEKYIIKENRRAIEYLWNLNILTTQTNDYVNDDSWITFGVLSEENQRVLDMIQKLNDIPIDESKPSILLKYGPGIRIPMKSTKGDTFEAFKELLQHFKPQDVQRDGYWTIDQFYSEFTGCVKMIDNPYKQKEEEIEQIENIEDHIKALEKFKREHGLNQPSKIPVYDPTKATKSLEEYLAELNLLDCYDVKEGRIYKNRRLYNGHKIYLESLMQSEFPEKKYISR